jgi:ferritin
MLEVGQTPVIPAIGEPQASYESLKEVISTSLGHEQKVTAAIHEIVDAAVEAHDHRAFQFLQWFVAEQIEEEATMEKLLDVVSMAQNELQAEHYIRHMGHEG